jgi:hypothetical protein
MRDQQQLLHFDLCWPDSLGTKIYHCREGISREEFRPKINGAFVDPEIDKVSANLHGVA